MIPAPPESWQLDGVRALVDEVAAADSDLPLAARLTASLTALALSPDLQDSSRSAARTWALLADGSLPGKADMLTRMWEGTGCLLHPGDHQVKVMLPDGVEAALSDAASSVVNLAWLQPGSAYDLAHRHVADVAIDLDEPAVTQGRYTLAGAVRWMLAVRPANQAVPLAVGCLTVGVVIASGTSSQ